jgi:septum formation protein
MSLQAATPALVLASGSATRRTLLEAAGLRFQARAVALDEAAIRGSCRGEGASAEETALVLAAAKATRVRDADALVIGADQILVCGEDWFGKAEDLAGARAQLLRLRGREHRLATAVVCARDGEVIWQHVEAPRLWMRGFSDGFLDEYLAAEGEALLGSVGCYRLEGLGALLFERVVGDHAAILGLPLLPLLGFLRQHQVLLG